LEAGAGFDAGAGLDAGAVLEAVAGSGAAVLEAVAGSGAAVLDVVAVLEPVAGSGAAVLDVVAVLEPVAGRGAAVLDAVAVLDVVAVLEPVAGSGAGAEVDASAESEAEAVSSAGAGSDVGGGSEAGCRSEAGCGSEAGGGAGSDAGGGPDAAPTRGIASKRFENFIPCLVPAPRSSCFSLFVAGERRSPVCCQEPSMRARRCMSVCTALVTPRTGPLTVVLPCPEESMPTSACAAALLESAWATAIAAQELPINRQAATMQTPAAKRKRAATTISPPPTTATSQTFATLLHISSGYRACEVVHARDGRRQITIYDTEAQLYKIRQHDCFPADLTDIAGLGDVIERAAGALGRPDILVNSRIRPSPPCRD
jgi:hypothetical protein